MKETIDDIFTELSCKGWQEAVDEIEKALEEKDKEIERLNNNWNELKQWIEKERDKWEKYHPDCFVYYQSILDRMEEIERWTKSE